MIQTASICHSKDGYILSIREVSLPALVIDRAIENVVLPATFHIFCCRIPEWTFKAGYGKDPDLDRAHSLGGLLFGFGQWLSCWGVRREREVYSRSLAFEEVCEHFPQCRMDYDDDGKNWVRGVLVS